MIVLKKILLFIFITLFLCGCNKIDIDSISKKFNDKVNNAKSYNLIGTMNILGDEENYTYLFDVSYKEDNLYKVILNIITSFWIPSVLYLRNGISYLNLHESM